MPNTRRLPTVRQRLQSRVGSHLVLGIRPEHLHLRPPDGPWAAITVRLNVVEPLGSEMDVSMSTALHDSIVARVEAQSGVAGGSEAAVCVELRKVHIFEPGETGMNLSLETMSPTTEPAHAFT